jgi:hypothetical protein
MSTRRDVGRLGPSNNYEFDYFGEGDADQQRAQRRKRLLYVGLPIALVAALACGIVATAIIVSRNKKKSATTALEASSSSSKANPFKGAQRPILVGVRADGSPMMMTLTESPSLSSHQAPQPGSDNVPSDGKVALVAETYPDQAIVLAGEKKDMKRMVFHCDDDNVCRLLEIESTVTVEEEAMAVDYYAAIGAVDPAAKRNDDACPPIDYERLKKQAGLTRKLSAILEMLPWFGEIPSEVRLCQSNLVIPLLSPMSYEDVVRNAKPMDLFCTRGHTTNGKFIQMIEHMSRGSDICTHVGLFVDTSVIRLNGMVDGELYVIESVIGGDLIPGPGPVYDIAGAAVNGVQIRSLKDIMISPENEATFFTWASLKPEYRQIVQRNVGLHVQPGTSTVLTGPRGGPSDAESTNKSLFGSLISFLSFALSDNADQSSSKSAAAAAISHYQMKHIPGKVNANCALTRSLPKYLAKPYPGNASNFVFGMTSSKVVTGMAAKCMSEIGEDYYCSELCANLYAEVGVLPRSMIGETARTIYPVDFITAGHPSLPVLFDSYRVILSPLMAGRRAAIAN